LRLPARPRKLGRAANRAGAIDCGSSHLRLKADFHSLLRLSGCLIVAAFAGWPAPQSALRAFAARQVTKTAFAAHEITQKQPQTIAIILTFREAHVVGVFVSCAGRFSCRGHLTQTEGRDGAETPGEGHPKRAIAVKRKDPPATFRPRRRRAVSSGDSRAARQMRRAFVIRAGRR